MWLLIWNENKSYKDVSLLRASRSRIEPGKGFSFCKLRVWVPPLCFFFLKFLCCRLLCQRDAASTEEKCTLEQNVSKYNNNLHIKRWIFLKWHRKRVDTKALESEQLKGLVLSLVAFPAVRSVFLVWRERLKHLEASGHRDIWDVFKTPFRHLKKKKKKSKTFL